MKKYHITRDLNNVLLHDCLFSRAYFINNKLNISYGERLFLDFSKLGIHNKPKSRNKLLKALNRECHLFLSSSFLYITFKHLKIYREYQRKKLLFKYVAIIEIEVEDIPISKNNYIKTMVPDKIGNISDKIIGIYKNPLDIILNQKLEVETLKNDVLQIHQSEIKA